MNGDLYHGRIVVAQSVVLVGRQQIVGSPTTKKSHRVVPLDPGTVTLLRTHKRRQLEERLAAGAARTDTGRVFTNDDGTGLRPDLLTRQVRALAAEAGLLVIRFHDLRHTSASLALAGGVPMRVVSERLGTAQSASLRTSARTCSTTSVGRPRSRSRTSFRGPLGSKIRA